MKNAGVETQHQKDVENTGVEKTPTFSTPAIWCRVFHACIFDGAMFCFSRPLEKPTG